MASEMTMTYEFITPEMAKLYLNSNVNNRKLSPGLVTAYAQDIATDNWDADVGSAISIDKKGVLRDGQHRLAAVIQANKGIFTWVCRNVASDGIYDNNRKRSNSDQISIIRPDLDAVYKSTRYISVAKSIIQHNKKGVRRSGSRRAVTPKEIIDFTEQHKNDLDGFFLKISLRRVSKISISTVYQALFMAYMDGVPMAKITEFYDILCSGMSTKPEEFPIIAYRNYLKDFHGAVASTYEELGRCQYALKKYLTKSCIKRNVVPKELFWSYPWEEEE